MLIYEISFNPISKHNTTVIKAILFQSFDSPKRTIPIKELPTTPIPVQIGTYLFGYRAFMLYNHQE